MSNIKLTSIEREKAKKLLESYFSEHHNQAQLNLDTHEGETEQKLFKSVLLEDGCPDDNEFWRFLSDRIWAIHETLHLGLLTSIRQGNSSVSEIRRKFKNMLIDASNNPNPQAVLDEAIKPGSYLGVSILSEALGKVYPDRFSIKNKRSEWGLYFILSVGPEEIKKREFYANFINISLQIWDLIADEYNQRKFSYDPDRRLWYVDRFYLWIYERPLTKQIMKSLGYVA
jgi:hypothetical protein